LAETRESAGGVGAGGCREKPKKRPATSEKGGIELGRATWRLRPKKT